jgi:predicted secreted protein
MTYDEKANGQQIDVKVNEEFVISLGEIPTAGYRWVTKRRGGPVLQLLEESTTADPSRVGGAARHLWHFRAMADGAAEIELHYVRPWESSAAPTRTFVAKVRASH